jgi:hypothetical protein
MTNAILATGLAMAFLGPAGATRHVDIGDSRALDALQAQNPAHYEKVVRILRVAGDVSCETLPQMLKVYDARNVTCSGALILTSYPAKRHLSFKLDETVYAGNVVLSGKPATLRYLTRP